MCYIRNILEEKRLEKEQLQTLAEEMLHLLIKVDERVRATKPLQHWSAPVKDLRAFLERNGF